MKTNDKVESLWFNYDINEEIDLNECESLWND